MVGYPIKFEWQDEDKNSLGKACLLFRCFGPYCSVFLVTVIASRRVQQVTFEVVFRLESNKSIHINIYNLVKAENLELTSVAVNEGVYTVIVR